MASSFVFLVTSFTWTVPAERLHVDHDIDTLTRLLLAGNSAGGTIARRTETQTMNFRSNRLCELLGISRRSLLFSHLLAPTIADAADNLQFVTASSGLQWADAKEGTGSPFSKGDRVTIDYVMSTTGARYGTKIDSTKDRQAPYSWVLGDGSTIAGLEEAIMGNDAVQAMRPGGVRRIIVPSTLAYADLARPNKNNLQWQDCTGRGPIPPNTVQDSRDMGAGEFQRFKNIYCNSNRPYQPDLVLDIKLYGQRK